MQVDYHSAEVEAASKLERERLLARSVVDDYLDCTGEFLLNESDGAESIGFNSILGKIIVEIRESCAVAAAASCGRGVPPASPGGALTALPLRLAVVGAPFSGKTSVAQELAQKFGLKVLDVESLVQSKIWSKNLVPLKVAEHEQGKDESNILFTDHLLAI